MVSQLLLAELDAEAPKTRASLERVPSGQNDFAPHPKSMPLGKLAPHIAQLSGFGTAVLSGNELNFATANYKPLALESAAQLVKVFDQGQQQVRAALAAAPEAAWQEPWTLRAGERVLFTGPRFLAFRAMYLNHIVHHRAQLGVYLRLLGVPVPSVYGPSADEQ